jgi:hypothetical protein
MTSGYQVSGYAQGYQPESRMAEMQAIFFS